MRLRFGAAGFDWAHLRKATRCTFIALAAISVAQAQSPSRPQSWPTYAADNAATHYSSLADIDRTNVSKLAVAWEWATREEPQQEFGAQPGNFQNTPLMIDNVLYVSTPYNRVAALDAETGKEIWSYDPKAYEDGQPPNGTGFVHRGVAAWRDPSTLRDPQGRPEQGRGATGSGQSGQTRIFLNSRWRLIALDARTGEPVTSFGTNGIVDLTQGLRREVNRKHYTNTSPPVVFRNLVILGNGVGDRLSYKGDPPGDVRAFDVRTGKQVWRFNTVPAAGEPFNDTWGHDSWRTAGHTNVWAPMALDDARGLLYLPVSTPSNDFYGGDRPGANVYGESLVCLDAATGVRKWHFQIVHHGLWDYDPASAPALVTMRVDGRRVDAVVQLTKQGLAFVFDRVTGKPIWPIEEKSVPQSDVQGEQAWPTQPIPTKPAPLAPQGVALTDAFDLTPELQAQARAEMQKYRTGPLYTPPSVQGTLMNPGIIGGANWGGSAFDSESGRLYVKTSNQPALARIRPSDRTAANPRASEVDSEFIGAVGGATFTPTPPAGYSGTGRMGGLPIVKPPYGELVALDLGRGEIAWRVPFGDTASVRTHPLLSNVKLPDRLGSAGAPGVIVTKGGLILGGGGDMFLYAFDKASGAELARFALQRRASATPMTYRAKSGRQFIVMATGAGANAALVAWALK
ncbi:MAG TPA: pyrroloquinoline quinone-dependent dehydrogenase [Vicinamibacterales bacterium]|nr:pyrroloquinoline quinone-dependent dehydrogenase [Vicinamibacterales bacterium]